MGLIESIELGVTRMDKIALETLHVAPVGKKRYDCAGWSFETKGSALRCAKFAFKMDLSWKRWRGLEKRCSISKSSDTKSF